MDILGDRYYKHARRKSTKTRCLCQYSVYTSIACLWRGLWSCVEENSEIVTFDNVMSKDGNYIVCIDPLDGSSNIDVNVSIGTIFSIYKRFSPRGELAKLEDFLQPGNRQVAAGYIVYGSSTMLVYTTGSGVNGFTLDPSIGEFCLSNINMKIPANGKIYSINDGNYHSFNVGIQKFIEYCRVPDKETGRPYSAGILVH